MSNLYEFICASAGDGPETLSPRELNGISAVVSQHRPARLWNEGIDECARACERCGEADQVDVLVDGCPRLREIGVTFASCPGYEETWRP
jgi:hypothetical protein